MKTRLFTRKRALISSVAMLLVAMIALGTATFAWFSTKTTATAKNVKVKTSQASSLVLSLDQQTWASEIDLAIEKTLEPGSTADLSNWFAATSTGYDQGTVDTDTIGAATADTNYVAKTFYAKSIGADMSVDWSILFDAAQVATDKNYMRAAMTISGNGITGAQKVFWWADGSTETGTSTNSTSAITSTAGATTAVTSSTATTGTISNQLTKDEVYTINLYVWFEGQDAQCIDTKAGTVCDFDIQFSKTK
jgi:hypothetical protein